MTYSQMVDVSIDPRWGRISECLGEDFLLNAEFGSTIVKGYQGNDLTSKNFIGACVKHFVGYGLSQGGRAWEFSNPTILDGANNVANYGLSTSDKINPTYFDGLTIQNFKRNGASAVNGVGVTQLSINAIMQNCVIQNNSFVGTTTNTW
ncbi:MAG: glycoside hydrolase family 3 N-terminal domain-containing protein [Bacteroidota bacterium]|nr:glycoside hydrolase family 3 N-terminal domain-containing protein [Bacteroidota bacterium]